VIFSEAPPSGGAFFIQKNGFKHLARLITIDKATKAFIKGENEHG
tara:strand:- start:842 stop:976 length:135 start_codon:yes stop_codon:yes gene_type:complete